MVARLHFGLDLQRRPAHAAAQPLDPVAAQLFGTYGLRRLLSAHGGPCIRVRRSSDNAQLDIGFLGGLLDTAALLAFVGSGSGTVVTWYDQSGHGHHATHATAALQPRIVNAGVLDIGPSGRPVMVFDGTNDELILADARGLARNVANATVAAVASPANGSTGYVVSAYATPDLRVGLVWQGVNNRFYGVGAGIDGAVATAFTGAVGSAVAGFNRVIARHRYGEAQGDLVTNGTVATSPWQTAAPTSDTDLRQDARIGGNGGGFQFAGAMSCIVLAHAALDIPALDAALARTMP